MRGRDGAARGAGDPLVQLCTFRVGGEDYAVDVMRVREIVRPLPVAPVPRAPAFVAGVVRLRGEVIPVVDVRERLGVPPSPPGREARLLVVNVARRRVALLVDEVCEVVRVPRSELRPAPALGAGGPRLFLGACGGDGPPQARRRGGPGRLRLLLDVRALLEPALPGEARAARAQVDALRSAPPAGAAGEGR